MTKTTRLILTVVLLPGLIGLAQAATQFIGQITQQVDQNKINGTTISTGLGNSDSGTQRVSISSDSPKGLTDAELRATAVPISAATLPLPAGAATSANQTTGNSSLSSIDGKLNSLGQKAMSASVPVVIASDQSAVTVTSALATSANVTKSSVTATTTSTQLLAADATRKGVECTSLCTNTDYAFLNINIASAATTSDYPISPCSSWSPPDGLVITGAIQVIAASGSQVVRCVSYTP